MVTFAMNSASPLEPQQQVAVNDRVSVPDGCVGRVIGFYRRAVNTVLVHLDSGDSREYDSADLHRVG